jgi:hypothetical protein
VAVGVVAAVAAFMPSVVAAAVANQ